MTNTRVIIVLSILLVLAVASIPPVYSQYAPPVPQNDIEASASIAIYTQKPVKKVTMDVSKINSDLGIGTLVVSFKNTTNTTYISMEIYKIKAETSNLPTSKPKYKPVKYFYVHYNFDPRLIEYLNITLNMTSVLGYNPKVLGVNLSYLAFAYYDEKIDQWIYVPMTIKDPPGTAFAIVTVPPSEFYSIVNLTTIRVFRTTYTVVQTQTQIYTKTQTAVSTVPVTTTFTTTVEKTLAKTVTKEKTTTKEVPVITTVTHTETQPRNTAKDATIYTVLIIIGLLVGYLIRRR
jgi:hypothetical protein